MNIKKMILAFVLIAIIGILSAILTVNKMEDLSSTTQKMYTHPFTVSNAVADIQTAIITMHKKMKDIVFTEDGLEMIKIIEDIQNEEDKVLEKYDLIYKNYLGNKKDIDSSYEVFKKWKTIREEIIALLYQKNRREAIAMTKGKADEYIQKLYKNVKVLKDYAFGKANEFYNKSVQDNGMEFVIVTMSLSIIISILIISYIIMALLRVNAINNRQLYLIDQNILMAKLSLDKKIIDISSSLCRILDVRKENILKKENPYFFTTKEQYKLFDTQIYSGKEYKGEVFVSIDDKKVWFDIEIFPELDSNFNIEYFNMFLNNISDKKKVEEIAIVDSLTGLNNRNYFDKIFKKEIRRSNRDRKPLSVLMFDIDYFKQYNDTYGHQEGDKALQSVAKVISLHTNRSYDHSFRVGGEEFVIVTYHDSFEKLNEFANTILNNIKTLKIPHKTTQLESKFLTISCGALRIESFSSLDEKDIYKKVDDLLYAAKKNGRNRVISKII